MKNFLLLFLIFNGSLFYSQNLWMEMNSSNGELNQLNNSALDAAEIDKDFIKAFRLADSLKSKAINKNTPEFLAFYKNTYATIFRMNGNYPLAYRFYKSALKDAKNNPNIQCFLLYGIYRTDIAQSDLKNAMKNLFEMLKIYEKEKNLYGIARTQIEIGGFYVYTRNSDLASSYLKNATETANRLNEKSLIYLINLYQIQDLLYNAKDYKKALVLAKKYFQEIKNLKDRKLILYSYENLSTSEYHLKNYPNALKYVDSAIAGSVNPLETNVFIANKASILKNMGKTKEAEQLLLQTLSELKKTKRQDYIYDLQKIIADFYQEKGDKVKAAEYIIDNDKLKENIYEVKKQIALREMDYTYNWDKKNKEISLMKENLNQLYAIIALSFIAICIGVFSVINYRKKTKISQQLQQKKLKLLETEKEKIKLSEQLQRQENEQKNREIALNKLYLEEKNKILDQINTELKGMETSQNVSPDKVKEIEKNIKKSLKNDEDWEKMVLHFEKANLDFFRKLKSICPKLTKTDLKQCVYIKLGLSYKDTANIMNISPTSVKVARYRLKKKLNLNPNDDIHVFIEGL